MIKLPLIVLTVNGITYDNTFDQDYIIDRTNLEEEFIEQPAKYAFYAFLQEEAEYLKRNQKSILERTYAALDQEKCHLAQVAGLGKYTEKMCENEVITDQRYKDAQDAYNKAELLAAQLRVCRESMAQRKDMLMQMGASARTGAQSPRILAQQAEDARELIRKSKENKGE